MAKKPEISDVDLDGLPSHDELDALQAQIDQKPKIVRKKRMQKTKKKQKKRKLSLANLILPMHAQIH